MITPQNPFFKILFYYNKLKKDNTFYEISYDERLC